MRTSDRILCEGFPCADINREYFAIPGIDIDPGKISLVMIAEAAPARNEDYFYSAPGALFASTTLQAFRDAGVAAESVQDLLNLGVYLTTAVKCAKTCYSIETKTIERCSHLLEQELALFPNVKVYMLMGDVAIRVFNMIAKRAGDGRVIPAGSTYKIRSGEFAFRGRRVFPSYLQAGPSFFIEKSKRRMISEDIAAALSVIQ